MRKIAAVCAIMIAVCLYACGCSSTNYNKENQKSYATPVPQGSEDDTAKSDMTTPVPTETPEPTPTPFVNTKATIGFVGDIMIMESQVRHAKDGSGYDFKNSFLPMRELFESVDIMCGNIETPIAGEEAGFSGTAPTMPPKTEENPNPVKPFQTFNAPDELIYNLKELGFDVLNTANNHCLDRGVAGLKRTLDVLDKAGIYHTGTYRNRSEREKTLIIEVNNIKVGICAFCAGFNLNDRPLEGTDDIDTISKMYDYDWVKASIEKLKNDGAEYIIAVPHCGTELSHTPESRHIELFENMIKWGADAVMSSHPHVVQPIEFVTVTRDDGSVVTAPVVYSLGNFISNMFPAPKNYGVYVKFEIEKTIDGVVTNYLSYVPVYCIRQETRHGTLHQVLPCFDNQDKIHAYEELDSSELKECRKCREYVIDICGSKYVSED